MQTKKYAYTQQVIGDLALPFALTNAVERKFRNRNEASEVLGLALWVLSFFKT